MNTILLLFSSLSIAIVNEPSSPEDSQITYKKEMTVDFEKGLEVDGQMIRPSGSTIRERTTAKFNPLVKLRVEFNQEMMNSANNIK